MSIAEQWKAEADRRRQKALDEAPTVAREFAGLPCIARRLDMQAWRAAGRCPEFFTLALLEALDGEEGHAALEGRELTIEEARDYATFQRACVCESLVEPKVVDKLPAACAPDEIAYSDFALRFPDAVSQIVSWQSIGAPDVPVRTEGGETSIDSLNSFRPSGEGRAASDARTRRTRKRRKRKRRVAAKG